MEFVAQQISPGEQIGPYQVVRRLGAGGMGEVYLARHRHLNRDAAVKVLLAEISMNQDVVSRFFTEARATAQLRHPHIVEIFDCDVLPDGRAYIVMEYLHGEGLRSTLDRVRSLAPDYGSIAAVTGMVADALQAAHEKGIVHRDLKPDNTYLTLLPSQQNELTVKVLDFGIAKLLSGPDRGGMGTPTRTGSLIGTPLYMSPEQCRGISTIDHRADIYSLGCVLFEMVVGQPPFVAEAPGDILMAHILQNAPPLASFVSDVPPALDTLVAQMLAKDPALRPQSMAEVVASIASFLGVRKADFGGLLKRPAGFPEVALQAVTQILPAGEEPGALVPTPSSAKPQKDESKSNRAANTPQGAVVTPSRQRGAPTPQGPLLSHKPATPGETSGRQRRPANASASVTEGSDRLSPAMPKWLIPVIVIALLVVGGGLATYFLTRQNPPPPVAEPEPVKETEPHGNLLAEPAKSPEPVRPADITVEIDSTPKGAAIWVAGESTARGSTPAKLALPRSSSTFEITLKAQGFQDKKLSLDATHDRTMSVGLQPREPLHGHGKLGEPQEGASQKKPVGKPGKAPSGGGFKAVGD